MKLLDILKIYDPNLAAADIKIHLASHNGREHPLDEYQLGRFDEWQSFQGKKNFEKKYVLSLIDRRKPNEWLFVGIYKNVGVEQLDAPKSYRYSLEKLHCFEPLEGRLTVKLKRPGRQPYRYAEGLIDQISVVELAREQLNIAEFPGYRFVSQSRSDLKAIVDRQIPTWKTALSQVAGVYLIRDAKTDKFYVGSATGEGGIWQRWSEYADGHGNVKAFIELYKEGADRLDKLQFSILETADSRTEKSEIIDREMFWIGVLGSRATGLNENGPGNRHPLDLAGASS